MDAGSLSAGLRGDKLRALDWPQRQAPDTSARVGAPPTGARTRYGGSGGGGSGGTGRWTSGGMRRTGLRWGGTSLSGGDVVEATEPFLLDDRLLRDLARRHRSDSAGLGVARRTLVVLGLRHKRRTNQKRRGDSCSKHIPHAGLPSCVMALKDRGAIDAFGRPRQGGRARVS